MAFIIGRFRRCVQPPSQPFDPSVVAYHYLAIVVGYREPRSARTAASPTAGVSGDGAAMRRT
jgi:hypothetical protein